MRAAPNPTPAELFDSRVPVAPELVINGARMQRSLPIGIAALVAATNVRCAGARHRRTEPHRPFRQFAANRHHPNPSEAVHRGDQTWEEMLIGWLTYTIGKNGVAPTSGQ